MSLRVALAACAMVVTAVVVVPGAEAATPGLRITSVDALCECGYIYMPWGWGETRVRFADPTRVPGDTYRLVVSPRRPASAERSRGAFWLLQGDARFRLGHTYTFRVREYDGSRLVETSPPYRWTPQRVGTPSAVDVPTTTMSNGVEALVAGTTYTLGWTGSWEPGTRVYADVITMDNQGQLVSRLAGHSDRKPVADPGAITFTPTADDVGRWVNIRVFGSKPGRVEKGFGGNDQLVFPVVASADDVAHAQHPLQSTWLGDLKTSGRPRVGSTVRVQPKIPASSDYLGLTVTYQWSRVNAHGIPTEIPGATGARYTVRKADRGKSLWVDLTYTPTNPDYAPYTQGYYVGDVKR